VGEKTWWKRLVTWLLLGAVGCRARYVTGTMDVAFKIAEITNGGIRVAVVRTVALP